MNGIANSGVITGQLFQSDFFQARFKAGTDEDFYMQFNGINGGDTFGTGVNSGTDVVGYGRTGWFAKNIEANEGTSDSTEATPKFIVVTFPNSGFTTPFGLNKLRAIVGALL